MPTRFTYIRKLVADPIFFRVCMFIWGIPFASLAGVVVISWRPDDIYEWTGLGLVFALGCGGVFLMYLAAFGSKRAIDKASNAMNEGGDIVGAIFGLAVFLIALPITALIRAMRSSFSE